MPLISRIIVPVDGSEYMRKEIEIACTLGRLFGAEITLLHIVAIPPPSGIEVMPEASKQLEEAGKKILEEARLISESFGITPKLEIDFSVGNPGIRIVKIAEAYNADLIVIGAKGRSRLREILMGSVANTVINNAPCLVLVVRSP
ncbi:MAG: universal stress protein [Candidatus Methanomethylicaceae archaeon]